METIASKSKPLQLSEAVQIHDTNRYITDDYVATLALNETVNRYSVGINVINSKIGVSSLSEYWHFSLEERNKALETYKELLKRVKTVVHDIEYEEIPMGLIQPIIARAVKDLENGHKERTGVFLVDVNKSEMNVEADWRNSIYGHRYPNGHLATMKSMWNKDEQSKTVVTENFESTRNRVVKYKKSEKEEDMNKYAELSKLAWFNEIRDLIKNKWPLIPVTTITSFIIAFLSVQGKTQESLAHELQNKLQTDPNSIKAQLDVPMYHEYKNESPDNKIAPEHTTSDPKLSELDPGFRVKVEKVLQKLRAIKHDQGKEKGKQKWFPIIADAKRTQEQQNKKVEQGFSQKHDSRHLYGLAVDIVDQRWWWEDEAKNLKHQFWSDLGKIAKEEGLTWGGDWKTIVDVAHIQQDPPKVITEPSANFGEILADTLDIEKGYKHDKNDRGGATNKGITLETYSKWLKKHKLPTNRINMKTIPDAHVNSIYKEEYWDVIHGDQLPPIIAQQLFDFAVNSGNQTAIKKLQSIIDSKRTLARELKQKGEDKLASAIITSGTQTQLKNFPAKSIQVLQQIIGATPDGKPGPKTISALNNYFSTGIKTDGIMGETTIEAVKNYITQNSENQLAQQLLQKREKYLKSSPDWKHFGRGWTKRLNIMESKIPGIDKKPMTMISEPKKRSKNIPERYTYDFKTPQTDLWHYQFPENNV